MHNEWEAGSLREANVAVEVVLLQGKRSVFPVEVEAGFAEGDDFLLAAETDDGIPVAGRCLGGVIGMDAGGGPDAGMFFSNLEAVFAGSCSGADGENTGHADGGCPIDHAGDVGGELV